MLGSSHDGERLAAITRAQAMLKAAGKTWEDVLGKSKASTPSADARMSAELAAGRLNLAKERAAFATEKALWHQRQQQWQREMSREQQERLARQHQEDLERYRAAGPGIRPDPATTRYRGPMYDEYDDFDRAAKDRPDAPDAAPLSTKWPIFQKEHPERAQWILDNKGHKEFAASLYQWV